MQGGPKAKFLLGKAAACPGLANGSTEGGVLGRLALPAGTLVAHGSQFLLCRPGGCATTRRATIRLGGDLSYGRYTCCDHTPCLGATPTGATGSVPPMKREEIAAQLVKTGEQRVAAMEARQTATEAFAKLIPLAYRAGIGVTEMTRLTGLTRRSIYDVLHESGISPSR